MPRSLFQVVRRSLTGKLLILAIVFLIVPLILYFKFKDADQARQLFLLKTLQEQGQLVARVLEPILSRGDGRTPLDAAKAVQELENGQVHVKLLLRPTGHEDTFFLLAENPPIDPAIFVAEQTKLQETFPHLQESCAGDQPLDVRYSGLSGQEEILTSLSPLHTAAGCWVIISSYATSDLGGATLGRPFSQTPEVRLAMGFYIMMAGLIALVVAGTLLNLRAFRHVAHHIRHGRNVGGDAFAAAAAIPELVPVAREFDRMVSTLDSSAKALREAAEDNAHAFKTPMATIAQSIELIRPHALPVSDALATMEQALARLGVLVQAAQRLDELTASLMDAKLQIVEIGVLAKQMAIAYDRLHASQRIHIHAMVDGPAPVMATEESLETVFENLLDNAVGFSPPGGLVRIAVVCVNSHVICSVEDEGPGVPDDQISRIFRRNFSLRPNDRPRDESAHSGIGLTIVRRTIELLGGSIYAENRPARGLKVVFSLPTA